MLNNKSSGVAIRSGIGSGDQISIALSFDVSIQVPLKELIIRR